MAKKKRTLRAWTKEELRDLKKFAKDKAAVAAMAKAMKRTSGALRQKASALGLTIGHQRRKKKRAK
jgi:hypothetical protein